ncbi:MAG: CdaR family protein [Candidatus Krumholzibacteriia bacterium]
MNRLGLKLACVVASVIIWIQVAATTTTEATLQLPLEVVNLPENTTVAGSKLPETVGVRVRGSKLRLLGHSFLNRTAGRVVVDLAGHGPGETVVRDVSPADVRSELETAAVQPPVRLRVRVDRQAQRRVPVVVPTGGSLKGDRQLMAPLRAVPDSVTLSGPQRLVAAVDSLLTEPVDLARLDQSTNLQREVPVPSPHLEASPDVVSVPVKVARVEERTVANVPVVPLVDADQAEVAVSPPVADLMVRGPADSIRALVPARLAVTLPVGGLPEGIHHLRGQVARPDWLTLLAVMPDSFMVIVGEPDRASAAGGSR